MNGVVFDKGKTGAIKHALSSQEYSALSSILTFDEIPTKLISSSQPNRNFILAGSKFQWIIVYTFKVWPPQKLWSLFFIMRNKMSLWNLSAVNSGKKHKVVLSFSVLGCLKVLQDLTVISFNGHKACLKESLLDQ